MLLSHFFHCLTTMDVCAAVVLVMLARLAFFDWGTLVALTRFSILKADSTANLPTQS